MFLKITAVILIQAFLCLDLSWAANRELKSTLAPKTQVNNPVFMESFKQRVIDLMPRQVNTKEIGEERTSVVSAIMRKVVSFAVGLQEAVKKAVETRDKKPYLDYWEIFRRQAGHEDLLDKQYNFETKEQILNHLVHEEGFSPEELQQVFRFSVSSRALGHDLNSIVMPSQKLWRERLHQRFGRKLPGGIHWADIGKDYSEIVRRIKFLERLGLPLAAIFSSTLIGHKNNHIFYAAATKLKENSEAKLRHREYAAWLKTTLSINDFLFVATLIIDRLIKDDVSRERAKEIQQIILDSALAKGKHSANTLKLIDKELKKLAAYIEQKSREITPDVETREQTGSERLPQGSFPADKDDVISTGRQVRETDRRDPVRGGGRRYDDERIFNDPETEQGIDRILDELGIDLGGFGPEDSDGFSEEWNYKPRFSPSRSIIIDGEPIRVTRYSDGEKAVRQNQQQLVEYLRELTKTVYAATAAEFTNEFYKLGLKLIELRTESGERLLGREELARISELLISIWRWDENSCSKYLKGFPIYIKAAKNKGELNKKLAKDISEHNKLVEKKVERLLKTAKNYIHELLFEQAAEVLKEAVCLAPDSPEVNNNLGMAYLMLKQYAAAVKCLQRVVALDAAFLEAYRNLSVAYCIAGDYRGAYLWLRKGLDAGLKKDDYALDSLQTIENFKRGFEYLLAGEYEKAIAYFDLLLDGDRDITLMTAHKYRSIAYFKLEEELGSSYSWGSLRPDPDLSRAYNYLGQAHLEDGRLEPAREEFMNALTVDSTNALAERNLESVTVELLAREKELSARQTVLNGTEMVEQAI